MAAIEWFRTLSVASSLLGPNKGLAPLREVYRSNVITNDRVSQPEDIVADEFFTYLEHNKSRIKPEPDADWVKPHQAINGASLASALIQFADEHAYPFHPTVTPPEAAVAAYIYQIESFPAKATLADQMKIALQVNQDSLAGALLTAMWASRLMARGRDTRIYPHILLSAPAMIAWKDRFVPLPTYDEGRRVDVPGDMYYFWTHCTAAYIYSKLEKPAVDAAFSVGTPVMVWARKMAGWPTMSGHFEATLMGRAFGKGMAEIV